MDKDSPYNYGKKSNHAARLQELVRAYQKLAEEPLKKRQKMLNAWASGYYSSGASPYHILNLTDRGVSTLVPFLVEGNPRVMVESRIPDLRPWAFRSQLALNFLIKKMDLATNAFIPAAINSMFGMGITRTSFVYDRLASVDNKQIKLGTPWVDVIDDCDYVGDPSKKRRKDYAFEGDIYQLPLDYAKDLFSKHADHISADCKLRHNFSPKEITSPNYDLKRLSLDDQATFIDIYLRDEKVVKTIMPHGKKAVVLREVEWEGPGDGPYDVLGYKMFPTSPIYIPPAWSWYDIDNTVNVLIEKMKEQAEIQKKVFAYSGIAEEDAQQIVDAKNTQAIKVDDVTALKELDLGGVNPLNFQWVNFMLAEQTKQGANPDVLGGRGAQAPTLGQEQMIYSNATRIVDNMYTRFSNFMESIIRKVAWAFWVEPTIYVPVVHEIPGVGSVPMVFARADKVADYYDFAFNVEPHSTQRMSPEIRYQKTMQFMSQWILPTMELAASQGNVVDIQTATKILAGYLGIENIHQWFVTSTPSQLQGQGYNMQPLRSAKGSQQLNDNFGAMGVSRAANSENETQRMGVGLAKESTSKKE